MAYEGERKLASICRIGDITPIDGADRIEVAHIHGWKIVVGKNEFKVGDLVVYFEIDSYLPIEPRYEFLRGRCFRVFKQHEKVFREGFRIKTCKLRGVISQGLVMPLSAFPEITARIHHFSESDIRYKGHMQYADKDVFITCTKEEYKELIQEDAKKYAAEHNWEKPAYCWEMYMIENNCELLEGKNVTQLLNIDHYDEVAAPFIPVSIPCGDKMSDFPSWIPKSDEERCVSGNTKIDTNIGCIRIDQIIKRKDEILIKSFNHDTGGVEFKPIVLKSKQSSDVEWYKLTFSNGKTLKCTGNHKIFLPSIGVYREVRNIVSGEVVLSD